MNGTAILERETGGGKRETGSLAMTLHSRGHMRIIGIALVMLAGVATAQKPTIQVTKVRTLVDRDGKGFTRAPMMIVPVTQGRYVLQEMNVLPIVVDSNGRLVKRFVRGEGPGE